MHLGWCWARDVFATPLTGKHLKSSVRVQNKFGAELTAGTRKGYRILLCFRNIIHILLASIKEKLTEKLKLATNFIFKSHSFYK